MSSEGIRNPVLNIYLWDQFTVTTVLNTGETGDIYLFSNCRTQSINYKLEEQIADPQSGVFVIWSGVLLYSNNLLHFNLNEVIGILPFRTENLFVKSMEQLNLLH